LNVKLENSHTVLVSYTAEKFHELVLCLKKALQKRKIRIRDNPPHFVDVLSLATERDKNIVNVSLRSEAFLEKDVSLWLKALQAPVEEVSKSGEVEVTCILPSDTILKSFKGPKYGVKGLRDLAGTQTSLRPHLSLSPLMRVKRDLENTLEIIYDLMICGFDYYIDPIPGLNLKKMEAIINILKDVGKTVGRYCIYFVNLAEEEDLFESLDRAIESGVNGLILPFSNPNIISISEDPTINLPILLKYEPIYPNFLLSSHSTMLLAFLAGGDLLYHPNYSISSMREVCSNNELKDPLNFTSINRNNFPMPVLSIFSFTPFDAREIASLHCDITLNFVYDLHSQYEVLRNLTHLIASQRLSLLGDGEVYR